MTKQIETIKITVAYSLAGVVSEKEMEAIPNVIYTGLRLAGCAREYAVRADGQWFERWQEKNLYGYRWGSWKKSSGPRDFFYIPSIERKSPRKARLPKD